MNANNDAMMRLLNDTVYCFISTAAEVAYIESVPLSTGYQAVELQRHKVGLNMKLKNGVASASTEISLISKQATFIERSALSRLYAQAANVPFSLANYPLCKERELLFMQDVDQDTDYGRLDIAKLQDKELQALAYIHLSNLGRREDLPWLPDVDREYIAAGIEEKWYPSWKQAKESTALAGLLGMDVIAEIERTAAGITEELAAVIAAEDSFTMIHNDLNPGNVLVHNNADVYFIDWEEARYGSLFLDIPMRCGSLGQAKTYLNDLSLLGHEIGEARFAELFCAASRYLGLRFMSWNLGVWQQDERAKDGLLQYVRMVTQPLFG